MLPIPGATGQSAPFLRAPNSRPDPGFAFESTLEMGAEDVKKQIKRQWANFGQKTGQRKKKPNRKGEAKGWLGKQSAADKTEKKRKQEGSQRKRKPGPSQ